MGLVFVVVVVFVLGIVGNVKVELVSGSNGVVASGLELVVSGIILDVECWVLESNGVVASGLELVVVESVSGVELVVVAAPPEKTAAATVIHSGPMSIQKMDRLHI